jgi:hypothetical protein
MMRPALAPLCIVWSAAKFACVHGQTALGGIGGLPPLQSSFGAAGQQGGLPQAPGPLQGSSFSGLGGMPSGMGQPPLQSGPASGLGSMPAGLGSMPSGLGSLPGGPGSMPGMPSGLGSLPTGLGIGLGSMPSGLGGSGSPLSPGLPASPGVGLAGSAQTGLPTLNLLGGTSMGQASATPQHIQQLQAQAVQSPALDTLCPGKQRSSTNIGEECWSKIWTAGGCKAANVPKYEDWHQTQSLEILVGDVVQWAYLPDDRHKQGCHGDNGPPRNEPAPPMGPQGGLAPPGLGMAPQGGGPLSGPGGMQTPLGLGAAPQGPAPSPEVTQKIMSALQSPDLANLCSGVGRSSSAVGEACWKNIWRHVGCLESTAPPYEEWHNTQSFEVLVADAAQWASLPSAKHRETCYGAHPEL